MVSKRTVCYSKIGVLSKKEGGELLSNLEITIPLNPFPLLGDICLET